MHGVLVLPEPSSLAWWLGRPLWLSLALLATALVAAALAGFERRATPAQSSTPPRILAAVMVGLGAVVLLLAASTSPVTAAISVTLIIASFLLVEGSNRSVLAGRLRVAYAAGISRRRRGAR
jgi:hypothetical protein